MGHSGLKDMGPWKHNHFLSKKISYFGVSFFFFFLNFYFIFDYSLFHSPFFHSLSLFH